MRDSDDIDDGSGQEQRCQGMGLGVGLVTEAPQKQESQKHARTVGEQPGGVRDGRELVQKNGDWIWRVEGWSNRIWRTNVLKVLSQPPSKKSSKRKAKCHATRGQQEPHHWTNGKETLGMWLG